MFWYRLGTLLLAGCLAVPLSAHNLHSTNPKERAKAAKALADQGTAALPALEKLLKDPSLKVRRQAVKSIVKIGTQYSLTPLVEATHDADPEIQMMATNGLVNFYLPGYVKEGLLAPLKRTGLRLKGHFTDVNDQVIPPDMKVRRDVVEAIAKLASGGSSMASRANAARAAGILRDRAAVPELLKAVKSKNSDVIYEALIALEKIRDQSAGPGIAFLLHDLDDRVQIAAIEATGLLQNRAALPELYDVLNNARNKKIRRAALSAIAMMPDERSRVYYVQQITSRDPLTRAAAAEGFGRLGNKDDIPMLERYFNAEKKMNPRLSLAFALVKLGKTDLSEFSPLQYLIDTLNKSSYVGVAQPFLVELARDAAVRHQLEQALASATKQEKIHLAEVLAISGDQATIPYLKKLSQDPDPEIATEGLRALRVLRSRIG